MFGAIAGALGGNLVNGLMGGGNGGGGGMLGGLGDVAGKLLDPLGIFGGQEQESGCQCQSQKDGDMKELIEMFKELISEMLAMIQEENGSEDATSTSDTGESETSDASCSHVCSNTGSGDDTVILN